MSGNNSPLPFKGGAGGGSRAQASMRPEPISWHRAARSATHPSIPSLEREGKGLRFAGYAAIFDQPDRGGDVIRSGAFSQALGEGADVPLLWQHERGKVIGRIEALEEDTRGLRVIATLEDAKLAAGVANGTLGGLSFGYRVRDGRPGKRSLRELIDLDLVEISLVTIPMQPLARVHAVGD